MVPAYLEQIDEIPMTTSDKADRKALPPPGQRASRMPAREVVVASNETERLLTETLASVLGQDTISVDADLFDEIGASSLALTQFSTALRKKHGLPRITIKEMYEARTLRDLATLLGAGQPGVGNSGTDERGPAAPPAPVVTGSSVRFALTGLAQLVCYLAMALLVGWVPELGYEWVSGAPDLLVGFGRAIVFSAASFVGFAALPVLVRTYWWTGGKPPRFRCGASGIYGSGWSRHSSRSTPPVLLPGPIYQFYLRLLGVKIGKNVLILSRSVPVVTDLITIGDGTVIEKDCMFSGYHAEAGVLRLGPVTLGRDVFVGEKTVLDIDTALGDGAQLGHSSALLPGQSVPAGASWHGSPAEPCTTNYRTVEPLPASSARKAGYVLVQLLGRGIAGPGAAHRAGRAADQGAGAGRDPDERQHAAAEPELLLITLAVGRRTVRDRAGRRADGHVQRATAAQPADHAGPRLSALRSALHGPAADHEADQLPVRDVDARRQLVHHRVPPRPGLRPGPGGADGLQLRHPTGPGLALPQPGG